MTTLEIKKRITEIVNERRDDEVAHSLEDDLRADFIEFIANSDCKYSGMAKEVMNTKYICFARWCA